MPDDTLGASDVDAEIKACYSHTARTELPSSHSDFPTSPAASASGFAGAFQTEPGDALTVSWDGRIDEVRWECEDRMDLPQTVEGATSEFRLPVAIGVRTGDGDFDETMDAVLFVRVDKGSGQALTEISTGGRLTLDELRGNFIPPPDPPHGG